MKTRKCYQYCGPVESLGHLISEKWAGVTLAISEKKARNNLAFQFKKEMGFTPSVRIVLPGAVTEVPRG